MMVSMSFQGYDYASHGPQISFGTKKNISRLLHQPKFPKVAILGLSDLYGLCKRRCLLMASVHNQLLMEPNQYPTENRTKFQNSV
jgi:hypothetical protein